MPESPVSSRPEGAHVEVPVNTSVEGVDPEPRKTGHRVVDFAIAGSAIVISLISLAVAIHHGRVQERLVAANSWPFLTWDFSNIITDEQQFVQFTIGNSGAGPAVLKSLVVRYRGKPVRGFVELLQECCGLARDIALNDMLDLGIIGDGHPVGVIRAQEESTLLRLAYQPEKRELWNRLGEARLHLTFEACYCSIIGECWKSDLKTLDPEPVEACKAGPHDYVRFGAGLDETPFLPVVNEKPAPPSS